MKDVFKILEQDARISLDRIATMTGLSPQEVEGLVQKAEKDRTILKYKTVIDWEKLGEQQVLALIEVKVTPERNRGFDAVAERVYRFPEARSVYLLSGAYDLAVLVVARDIYEVSRFVSEKLATLESVRGTVTHFLLKRYKEDGEVLVERKESRRQPLVP